MPPHAPQTRIGISGWTYGPWRGTFYPKGLPQKQELEHASRKLNSIEINGSFYSLQRPSSYQGWYEAKVKAPYDAMNLAARLGVCAPPNDTAPDAATITEAPRTRWTGFRGKRDATG